MRGDAKIILVIAVSFLLGVALTGLWVFPDRTQKSLQSAEENAAEVHALSAGTRAVLNRLSSPIEVRYYALLDSTAVPDDLKAFVGRARDLLGEYEREANGKIKLVRYESRSQKEMSAALRDGIKPFSTGETGDCFLGVALVLNNETETIPRLAPEWEAALESDVTRGIARLLEATRGGAAPAVASQLQKDAAQEIKILLPDFASLSLEEGTRKLREAGLKEFQTSAKEAEIRVKEAQAKLVEAKSAEEQEAARNQLLQVQAEQVEKLKQLAARSQAQVEAFERLKAGPP